MGVRAPFERAGVVEVLQAASAEGGRFRFHLRGIQTVVEFSFANGQIVPNGREAGTAQQRLILLALADGGEVERLGVFATRDHSQHAPQPTPEWLPLWWEVEHRADELAAVLEKAGLKVSQRLWPDYHQMMAKPELSDVVVSILRMVDGGRSVAELVVMGPKPPKMIISVLVQTLQAGFISIQPVSMPRMIDPHPLRPVGGRQTNESNLPRRASTSLPQSSFPGYRTPSSPVVEEAFAAAFLPIQGGGAKHTTIRWYRWPWWIWVLAVGALASGIVAAILVSSCEKMASPNPQTSLVPTLVPTSTVSMTYPQMDGDHEE